MSGCRSNRTAARVGRLASRAVFLLTLALFTRGSPAWADEAPAPRRPNVLFFLADDLGYGDLGCYGHERIQTPHLDALARQGTRFMQFYVSGCTCSPTRASAITGQYPARWRMYGPITSLENNRRRTMPDWLDPAAPSMPRAMQQAGYRTAHFGKWHLGGGSGSIRDGKLFINHPDAPPVASYGFDDVRATYGNAPTWRHAEPVDAPHDIYPYDDPDWQTWSSRAIADATIEFLEQHAAQRAGQPFLVHTWFKDPHTPMAPTPEMRAAYADVAEPAQTHYAMITFMDQQIGRVLAALDRLGLADNTLVIFSSDNGAAQMRGGSNGPLRDWKWYLYEGGIRVPLIVRWPGHVPSGRVDETSLVNLCDLVPTFCRLAGARMPEGYRSDGIDISAVLRGDPLESRPPMMWDNIGRNSSSHALAIRDGRWKLLIEPDGSKAELYDLQRDAGEANNLAEAQPAIAARLRRRLLEWYAALPPPAPPLADHHRPAARPIPPRPPLADPQPFGMRARAPAAWLPAIEAPVVVAAAPQNESKVVRLPDGSLRIYFIEHPGGGRVRSVLSRDGGLTWHDDRAEFDLPGRAYYAVQVIVDHQQELHAVFHIFRGEGRRAGIDRLLDVWHCRTSGGRATWSTPQRIFEGYVGSLRGGIALDGGRLIVPMARAVPERFNPPPEGEPDYGRSNTIVLYSNDSGSTWQRSPAELMLTLCGPNNTRYGAIEPNVIQLADGRVWMLIRDRCGRLYESYSPDGIAWHQPKPTRFISSDSPAETLRLPDGRIVLFCCANQRWDDPRSYAMGGREVLHAAISSDEGHTWQGWREVLNEPLPPVERGDRGSAYPSAAVGDAGKVVLVAGQGPQRPAVVLFDPDWLTATSAVDDFSRGLEQWTLYGSTGARLVHHSQQGDARLLAIQKTIADAPAGALWNFPAGAAGTLTARVRLESGFNAAELWLTDHFSVIADAAAPDHAVYRCRLRIDPSGSNPAGLQPGVWHTLTLAWTAGGEAALRIDDRAAIPLPLGRASETGINYLGLRSAAAATDSGGLQIERVSVQVEPPGAAASNAPP